MALREDLVAIARSCTKALNVLDAERVGAVLLGGASDVEGETRIPVDESHRTALRESLATIVEGIRTKAATLRTDVTPPRDR